MDIEKMLTTEALKKMRPDLSTFDLVTWAIKRAQNMIKTGRESYVKTESQSRATQILAEIGRGKDSLDAFEDMEEDDTDEILYNAGKEFTDIAAIVAERSEENKETITRL